MIGTKILEERRSSFNGKLKVLRTVGLGTYIQANGLTQSGGIVEKFWNQTIKKIYRTAPTVKKLLILGLGGGSVAKLAQKYWASANITGVDIDPVMIELGSKYLGLEAGKLHIVIQDAYSFDSTEYDLVVVDVYRGDKFPKKFESMAFLNRLKRNRLVVFNRLYYGSKKAKCR